MGMSIRREYGMFSLNICGGREGKRGGGVGVEQRTMTPKRT